MNGEYLIHVKSTLDKTMVDLVTSLTGTFPNLKGMDLDNLVETDSILSSPDPVILWQFLTLMEVPKDPLYRLEFLVGAKTYSDHSNNTLINLVNQVGGSFEVEDRIDVGNYSGASPVLDQGYFVITDNSLAPQQYNKLSGIRFFSIRAMGARKI